MFFKVFFILMTVFTFSGCSVDIGATTSGDQEWNSNGEETKKKSKSQRYVGFTSLHWEKDGAIETRAWSLHLFGLIEDLGQDLLGGSKDIQGFCPSYGSLDDNKKIQVWGQIFSALSFFESRHNPRLRFKEPGDGLDAVTGLPLFSEGLLQMSYQDKFISSHCSFDWRVDQRLSSNDAQKTIFDPLLNLRCGVAVLNQQIKKYDRIVIGKGAYWAVLRYDGRYQRIREIVQIVKELPFCQEPFLQRHHNL